jgi:hypothetical protein
MLKYYIVTNENLLLNIRAKKESIISSPEIFQRVIKRGWSFYSVRIIPEFGLMPVQRYTLEITKPVVDSTFNLILYKLRGGKTGVLSEFFENGSACFVSGIEANSYYNDISAHWDHLIGIRL